MHRGDDISLRDVYDIVNRLEDKVDRSLDGHNRRISSLEEAKSFTSGGFAAVAFIISSAVTLVGVYLDHMWKSGK